jgi:transcriptional regulator with XRE-family HTH domain
MKEIETLRKFGRMIRQKRKEKEWTQQELANASGVHVNWIGRIERGLAEATLSSARKILSALGLEIEITKKE